MSTKTVVRNSIYIFIARIIDTAGGIALVLLSARYLASSFGIEVNGQYASLVTLVGLAFTMANAGLAPIIIRDVAVDRTRAPAYLRSLLTLRILLGIFSAVVILAVVAYLPVTREMRYGVLIAITAEMGNAIAFNYMNLFYAYERMDYETIAAFLFRAITLIFTLLIIWFQLHWLLLFVATVFGSIGRLIYVIWRSREFTRPAKKLDVPLTKSIFMQAFPIGVALLLTQGYLRIDALVLWGLSSYEDVAVFFYPYRLLLEMNILPMALTTPLFPVISRAAKNNGAPGTGQNAESLFVQTFKFYLILSLPIMVFGFIYAKPIITMLLTDKFAQSGDCLRIIIWGTFFVFIEFLMTHYLIAIGRQRVLFMANGSCLAVSFFVDVLLIKYFKMGAIGASIGTISAYTALFCIMLYYVSRTVSIKDILRQVPRPLIAAALCLLLFMSLQHYPWYLMIPLGLEMYLGILILIRAFTEKEINMFRMVLRPPRPADEIP